MTLHFSHMGFTDARTFIREDRIDSPGDGYRPDSQMDLTRLETDTGYKPKYDLQTAVGEYIDWLRTNPV